MHRADIRYAHKLAHLDTPTDSEAVKATLRGIRRTVGAAKVRKAPAVAAKVRVMVALAPEGLKGVRDRALLLLGFAGAFRRSELVALDVADIAETETGLLVTIRRSKTDQDGEGVTIAIPRGDVACPVRALREWLDAAGIEAGPIFRPINKAGTVSGERLTDRSVDQYRQGLCRTRRLRRQLVLTPLAAVWFPDLSGGEGCINFQDDGCLPSQVG